MKLYSVSTYYYFDFSAIFCNELDIVSDGKKHFCPMLNTTVRLVPQLSFNAQVSNLNLICEPSKRLLTPPFLSFDAASTCCVVT